MRQHRSLDYMSYRENKNQQNLLNQFLAEYGVQLSEDTIRLFPIYI